MSGQIEERTAALDGRSNWTSEFTIMKSRFAAMSLSAPILQDCPLDVSLYRRRFSTDDDGALWQLDLNPAMPGTRFGVAGSWLIAKPLLRATCWRAPKRPSPTGGAGRG